MGVALGVMFPGDPTARGTWSGTPNNIVTGLRELGVEVHGINVEGSRPASRWLSLFAGSMLIASIARAELPLRPREIRSVGRVSPVVARMRSTVARRRLSELPKLDGLIQIGTGYAVQAEVPLVTVEDMTISQACADDYEQWPQWRALPARAVAAHLARQRETYQRARACCACTHWAGGSLMADYGVPSEKVHVVGVGRNFEPIGTAAREWSPPRFLFVGRDWERKNGPRVLAAFARLRVEVPDARLDVVGAHPPLHGEGVLGHGVLRLTNGVERARLSDLFANATCFVMPSLSEPAGLAYVEASAWGIPSIATANGGAGELVGDGGIVIDPLDDDQLLQAMRELADPATAERLGRAARERSRLFTSRTLAGRLLRALELPSNGAGELAAFL